MKPKNLGIQHASKKLPFQGCWICSIFSENPQLSSWKMQTWSMPFSKFVGNSTQFWILEILCHWRVKMVSFFRQIMFKISILGAPWRSRYSKRFYQCKSNYYYIWVMPPHSRLIGVSSVRCVLFWTRLRAGEKLSTSTHESDSTKSQHIFVNLEFCAKILG